DNRPQISPRRRRPPSIADGILSPTEALLLLGVIVLRCRKARLFPGFNPRIENGVLGFCRLRPERSIASTPLTLAAFPRLTTAEVGQGLRIAPSRCAVARPTIVIVRMATRVSHHIDGRAATEHLSAHRLEASVVEIGFRFRLVSPIVHAMLVHLSHAERNGDKRIDVAAPSFKEKYARLWIFAKTMGEHAARGSAAHDHVIERPLKHSILAFLALRSRVLRITHC